MLTDIARHFTTHYLAQTSVGKYNALEAGAVSEIQGRLVSKIKTIKLLDGREYSSASRFQTFEEIQTKQLIYTSDPRPNPKVSGGQEILMVESASLLSAPGVKMYIGYL